MKTSLTTAMSRRIKRPPAARLMHSIAMLLMVGGVSWSCNDSCRFQSFAGQFSHNAVQVNQSFSVPVSINGGCGYSYGSSYVSSGALPPGMYYNAYGYSGGNFSGNTVGQIQGTPTIKGTYTVVISVRICYGRYYYWGYDDCVDRSQVYTITVI